jgi:hypothetical protein
MNSEELHSWREAKKINLFIRIFFCCFAEELVERFELIATTGKKC